MTTGLPTGQTSSQENDQKKEELISRQISIQALRSKSYNTKASKKAEENPYSEFKPSKDPTLLIPKKPQKQSTIIVRPS